MYCSDFDLTLYPRAGVADTVTDALYISEQFLCLPIQTESRICQFNAFVCADK